MVLTYQALYVNTYLHIYVYTAVFVAAKACAANHITITIDTKTTEYASTNKKGMYYTHKQIKINNQLDYYKYGLPLTQDELNRLSTRQLGILYGYDPTIIF